MRRLTFLCAVPVLISATNPIPKVAHAETIPQRFQGLWVSPEIMDNPSRQYISERGEYSNCPFLSKDEDMRGAGEGSLLLKGDKFFKHEELCRVSKINSQTEDQLSASITCGRAKASVHLRLRATGSTTELQMSSSSGHRETYRRCK